MARETIITCDYCGTRWPEAMFEEVRFSVLNDTFGIYCVHSSCPEPPEPEDICRYCLIDAVKALGDRPKVSEDNPRCH